MMMASLVALVEVWFWLLWCWDIIQTDQCCSRSFFFFLWMMNKRFNHLCKNVAQKLTKPKRGHCKNKLGSPADMIVPLVFLTLPKIFNPQPCLCEQGFISLNPLKSPPVPLYLALRRACHAHSSLWVVSAATQFNLYEVKAVLHFFLDEGKTLKVITVFSTG